MPSLLNEFLSSKRFRQITDSRNIGLYIFTIIIMAITWSGVKAIQNNYELQKKIAVLKQQNEVADLQNGNIALQNQYYKTDQYLELAARQQLGLAARGETVLLVPKNVALGYVDNKPASQPVADESANRSGLAKNLEAWRDFLFGHNLKVD